MTTAQKIGGALIGVIILGAVLLVALNRTDPVEPDVADLGFILKDMDGKDVRLSDFRGRPLIVNFWYTTCAPCRQEVPAFVKLVSKYGDQGFTILGISVDDTPEDLRAFAAEFKMNYPVLVAKDRDDVMEAYRATFAYPVSWFVTADGKVLLKHLGTATPEWFEQQVLATLKASGIGGL